MEPHTPTIVNTALADEVRNRRQQQTYEVGQIFYVISSDNDRIIPMQVCEEIRRRTINGEEVTYLIRSGPETKGNFRMDELNGAIFATLDQAKVHLQNRFTMWLDKQVEWTTTSEKAWYAPTSENQ